MAAAALFTAAMAESGHPLPHSAWASPARPRTPGGPWTYRWIAVTPDRAPENKARLLVAHSLGLWTACTRCWFDSDNGRNRDRWKLCRDGRCPYGSEVVTPHV